MPPNHQTEGIDGARIARAAHPDIGVVILSQHANALYAFELFQHGTAGLAYLLKDRVGDLDELVRAIVAVHRGESMIDPQVVEGVLARGATMSPSGMIDFTAREHEVLREIAQGKSNHAIAEALYVSESAVEKHISAILAKLELDPHDSAVNRRVAAVLTFLRSCRPAATEG